MKQGPRYDFPVITDDPVEEPKPYAETSSGESILRDERAFRARHPDQDEDFEYDDEVGVVHIDRRRPARPPDPPHEVVRVVFRFADGDTLTASGTLPEDLLPEDVAVLAVVGATGKLKKHVGRDLRVRSKNPKRWSIPGFP